MKDALGKLIKPNLDLDQRRWCSSLRNGHDHEFDGVAQLRLKQIPRASRNKHLAAADKGNNSVDTDFMQGRPRQLMQREYDSYMPRSTTRGREASQESLDEFGQAGFADSVSQLQSKKLKL